MLNNTFSSGYTKETWWRMICVLTRCLYHWASLAHSKSLWVNIGFTIFKNSIQIYFPFFLPTLKLCTVKELLTVFAGSRWCTGFQTQLAYLADLLKIFIACRSIWSFQFKHLSDLCILLLPDRRRSLAGVVEPGAVVLATVVNDMSILNTNWRKKHNKEHNNRKKQIKKGKRRHFLIRGYMIVRYIFIRKITGVSHWQGSISDWLIITQTFTPQSTAAHCVI